MIHTLSYPLTHSPTHSHSLTHLLTHPLTHPLTHSPLTYLLSVLTHSPTHPRSHHRSPSLAHSRPTSTTAHPRSVLYGSPPAHTLPSTYSLPTHYLLTIYSLSTHTIHSRLQVRGLWKTECNKTVGAYNKHMYIPYYCRPLAFGGGQSDDQSQLEYATLDDGDTDAIEKNLKTREGEVGSGAGGAGGAGGEKGR